ncbi:hypothetical protein EB796_008648 [Bugula neritina]|uniref:U3 small nucleolar RNA-associated protein 20 N-terminal domain-containing protein n=1 Tax=Bugula neritina TaxID=10212 RepID=A0A7J7K4C4_BUGNE|nr:hypothetical protein EB796_008648 [Bugula neritina]
MMKKRQDFPQSLDLCKATPPKKVLGVLSTIVSMMEKLNHLMAPHYTKLLHLLLSLIQYAAFLLDEKRDQINNKTINSMKTARQTAIKCLAQFMDKNLEYIYTDAECQEYLM